MLDGAPVLCIRPSDRLTIKITVMHKSKIIIEITVFCMFIWTYDLN
ncbi:MAG: hypothetical protein K0R55_4413 [Sporomusa sp.]|jgi:hypothetical protein|nr:hypothetical protein [Sporomusa sp.]